MDPISTALSLIQLLRFFKDAHDQMGTNQAENKRLCQRVLALTPAITAISQGKKKVTDTTLVAINEQLEETKKLVIKFGEETF